VLSEKGGRKRKICSHKGVCAPARIFVDLSWVTGVGRLGWALCRTLAAELLSRFLPILCDKCPSRVLFPDAAEAVPSPPPPVAAGATRAPKPDAGGDYNDALLRRLLGRLLGRTADRSAVVRARALSCLTAILNGRGVGSTSVPSVSRGARRAV